MEAATVSAASRVIVELTDPSNLWDTFEPLLVEHLPLHNLHWKSPNRPLRSIDTLNVAITRAEASATDVAHIQRRHQIPGLKETPYLKIYLLRCDDSETYKETCRKQIRQWIKNNSQSQSNKASQGTHEKHDAFEWLILHAVLPETPAAAQPRFSKHSNLGTTDSTDSLGSKSKWPGKSSSTLFEKLRADFNNSSKSALERVAQIRLHGPHQPSTVLPIPEVETQWGDLVEKLKASILSSFHIRVAQYEDDIRERDSQRHLPGWNFCTFFILKEGLALGFESVGLLEDASMIYDELALGLDLVIRAQLKNDASHEGSLLLFSKELKDKIRSALGRLQLRSDEEEHDSNLNEVVADLLEMDGTELPLDTSHKKYRELILSNNISSLDFRIYVFARQLELLYRSVKTISNVSVTNSSAMFQHESFSNLAEMNRRASVFINLASRCMRSDLYNAWGGKEGLDAHDLEVQRVIIENIVSTWAWRAILQILSDTATKALIIHDHVLPIALNKGSKTVDEEWEGGLQKESNGNIMVIRPISGILEDTSSDNSSTNNSNDEAISEKATDKTSTLSRAKFAASQLAASRGELYLLGRRILEQVAPHFRTAILPSGDEFQSVLNGNRGAFHMSSDSPIMDTDQLHRQDDLSFNKTAGLDCSVLRIAAQSRVVFIAMYEKLTTLACQNFLAAEKSRLAEKALIDLAVLKFRSGDFATTAEYLEHVTSGSNRSWTALSRSTLVMYSECLKCLGRQESLVLCLLDILSLSTSNTSTQPRPTINSVQEDLANLLSTAKELTTPVNVPLNAFFELAFREVPSCRPNEQHGTCLEISLRAKIPAVLRPNKESSVKLTASTNTLPAKIVLNLVGSAAIGPIFTSLKFASSQLTMGWYHFESLRLCLDNLVFIQEFENTRTQSEPRGDTHLKSKPVLVYPPPDTPIITATPSPELDLSQSREVLIEVKTARREVNNISLSFRPATAGLRLHISEADLVADPGNRKGNLENGQLPVIEMLQPGCRIALRVPYSMENPDITELEIGAEVSYTTDGGRFTYHTSLSVSTILQLSVNVHDMFKTEALFSRFTITPSTLVPLRLRGCRVEGTDYDCQDGEDFLEPVDVFPKQPASWLCRFTPPEVSVPSNTGKAPKLLINFECLDEMVLSALETQFLQAIYSSECAHLATLLCAHLTGTYRSKWTEHDLESACLLQEVDLWNFNDLAWKSILAGLDKKERETASQWLHQWHDELATVALDRSTAPLRTIAIPIEIPTPKVVVSVSLNLSRETNSVAAISLGQPAAAEVVVSHTNRWQAHPSTRQRDELEVVFELTASPDIWLIGGNRRGTMNRTSDQQRFQVLLLPQRTGHLMLPSIEVKCFFIDTKNGRMEVACETDYASQARTVLVIGDVRSTTWTSMGEGAPSSVSGG